MKVLKIFFLVGTNSLNDPRFKDAVVLMKEHDTEGALGIVINKPIGLMSVSSLIKVSEIDMDKKIDLELKVPIFWGGPLDQKKIFVIHSNEYKNKNTKLLDKVSISSDYKILKDIADNKVQNLIIVLGLAAWNEGQLEGEIDKGWWNLSEIDENILFEKINKKTY